MGMERRSLERSDENIEFKKHSRNHAVFFLSTKLFAIGTIFWEKSLH